MYHCRLVSRTWYERGKFSASPITDDGDAGRTPDGEAVPKEYKEEAAEATQSVHAGQIMYGQDR